MGAEYINANGAAAGYKPEDIYLEVPAEKGTLGFTFHQSKAYPLESCIPSVQVPLSVSVLGLDRERFVAYRCQSKKTGFMHIDPINDVLDRTTNKSNIMVELRHKESKKLL